MSIRALFLASVAIATMSTPVLAQAVAELEGKVTSMPMTGTGPATTITSLKIFNSNITLKPATTFATPTRDGMTANDIGVCNRRAFAGMSKTTNTMVGGTGIVVGTSADSTGTSRVSVVTADTVFLEPAENVLLGRITKVPTFDTVVDPVTGATTKTYAGGTLEIEGTNVVVLGTKANGHFPPIGTVAHNPCLPGLGVKNDVGFPIPPDVLAQGAEAAAEGWYGEDNTFYAFLIESVGAPANQQTAVSITRAQCRQRTATQMEWEIRGGTADPIKKGDGRVNIGRVNAAGAVELYTGAFTNAVADPLNEPYGLYTFKANIDNQGLCPETVVVRYVGTTTVGARAGVDRR